ncbi:MAG: hypothetical protein QW212_03105 [Nitrososphaerales archaeon]
MCILIGMRDKLYADMDNIASSLKKKGLKVQLLEMLYDKIMELISKGYSYKEITIIVNKAIIKNRQELGLNISEKAKKVLNEKDIRKFVKDKEKEKKGQAKPSAKTSAPSPFGQDMALNKPAKENKRIEREKDEAEEKPQMTAGHLNSDD